MNEKHLQYITFGMIVAGILGNSAIYFDNNTEKKQFIKFGALEYQKNERSAPRN